MKKTYINPSIEVIKIASQHQMLAASEVPVGTDGSANDAEGRGSDDFDWDD